MKKTFVVVQFNKEGYHQFPGAISPEFSTNDEYDVSHLALRHMHYFYFRVWVQVSHNDRDIEFIQLRRWLESLFDTKTLELNNKSCEMISDDLYEKIFGRYPGVEVRIEVLEDNINGSYVEYPVDASDVVLD